jgi:hypothetical protein
MLSAPCSVSLQDMLSSAATPHNFDRTSLRALNAVRTLRTSPNSSRISRASQLRGMKSFSRPTVHYLHRCSLHQTRRSCSAELLEDHRNRCVLLCTSHFASPLLSPPLHNFVHLIVVGRSMLLSTRHCILLLSLHRYTLLPSAQAYTWSC